MPVSLFLSSSRFARHPTNSRCEPAHFHPSLNCSRFIHAAAPPAATAPAAPANMAYFPHLCHAGVVATSASAALGAGSILLVSAPAPTVAAVFDPEPHPNAFATVLYAL